MAEEEKHEEPEKTVPKIVLKQPIITAGLSQLGQTFGNVIIRRNIICFH